MIGIGIIIGFILASIFYFVSDNWRIKRLCQNGYDGAVRDITEYGYYYNKDNKRIYISVNGEKNE